MPRIIGLHKLKARRSAVPPGWRSLDNHPPRSSVAPMHHIFLNEDILIQIASWLGATPDHVAFATTSRWCYIILKRTIFSHVALRPDGPAFTILPTLLDNPALCTYISNLDVILSSRPNYSAYVPGRDDIQQMWKQRGDYVRDVRVVLERAIRLKKLNISEGIGEHLPEQLSLGTECGGLPFNLTSLRMNRATPNALKFIDTHPELNHLILTQRSNSPHDPDNWHLGFSSVGDTLHKLKTLWASPWWMRAFLMRSPVRTFGLVHKLCHMDYLVPLHALSELAMLVGLLNALGNIGGHPTVRCLAIPWNDFTLPNTSLTLRIVSKAFPRAEKLAVTLDPGQLFASGVLLSVLQSHARALGPNSIFQAVREFCFLLPEEWPHDQKGCSPEIRRDSHGKDLDFVIPRALSKLMPGLVHIDTPDRCYSRVGAGVKHPGYGYRHVPLGGCDPVQFFGEGIRRGEWHGEFCFNVHVPQDHIIWFGRPRRKCPVAEGWT